MGKIYCIMGKSSTGKDTLFKKILGDESLSLKTIVPYTTRPVRAGEKNGVEYFSVMRRKWKNWSVKGVLSSFELTIPSMGSGNILP